jgi:hypothetical protein
MEEAQAVVRMAAPYIGYVTPALIILSCMAIAEHFFSFVASLIDWLRKRRYKL